MKKINEGIGFLGDINSLHFENLSRIFSNAQSELYPLELNEETAPSFLRTSSVLRTLWRCAKPLSSVQYSQKLHEFFKAHPVKCLIAFWGTRPLREIRDIKKSFPNVKIVLNLLCHPLGLTPGRIFLQNCLMSINVRYLDGIIYSSQVMRDYFEKKILGNKTIPYLIMPPCLSNDYFPEEDGAEIGDHPNLIFLGRMDWWAGQPTDNVTTQLSEIMDAGIHVYHSDKAGSFSSNPYRHVFKPMSQKAVIQYGTRFDASLILYNLDQCSCSERFDVTIPDRLVASISAGIPVVLPKEGYRACKELLGEYGAVIEYATPDELKMKLSNRKKLIELKTVARNNMRKFVAEDRFFLLSDFLHSVCAQ